jgi:nucleoside-diphosphate-sugar epimerase
VKAITEFSLVDVVAPEKPRLRRQGDELGGDISFPNTAGRCVAGRPDVIFHLAAIVSGEAEVDFDKGYRINLDGTRQIYEAIRQEGVKAPYHPRVVFTSSIAVYGAPFHDSSRTSSSTRR